MITVIISAVIAAVVTAFVSAILYLIADGIRSWRGYKRPMRQWIWCIIVFILFVVLLIVIKHYADGILDKITQESFLPSLPSLIKGS